MTSNYLFSYITSCFYVSSLFCMYEIEDSNSSTKCRSNFRPGRTQTFREQLVLMLADKGTEMDILTNKMEGVLAQHILASNHHRIHFK